jgi:N-acetylmuramoyl-L-alanine amidase
MTVTSAPPIDTSISPTVAGSKDIKLHSNTTFMVKVNEGYNNVNIRLKPTIESEIVGKANSGDTFELVSEEQGWFQIKLTDGTGYISSDFATLESEVTN